MWTAYVYTGNLAQHIYRILNFPGNKSATKTKTTYNLRVEVFQMFGIPRARTVWHSEKVNGKNRSNKRLYSEHRGRCDNYETSLTSHVAHVFRCASCVSPSGFSTIPAIFMLKRCTDPGVTPFSYYTNLPVATTILIKLFLCPTNENKE